MAEINYEGETMEALFEETGERDAVYSVAIKRVLAWQLEQCRAAQHITKAALAEQMGTSRTQVKRVLDPANIAVSLETMVRAAHALGKELRIELVEPGSTAAAE